MMRLIRLSSAAAVLVTGIAAQSQETGLAWQLRNCDNVYDRMIVGCDKIDPRNKSGWYSQSGCRANYQAAKNHCIELANQRDASIRASDQRNAEYQAQMKAQREQYSAAQQQQYQQRLQAQRDQYQQQRQSRQQQYQQQFPTPSQAPSFQQVSPPRQPTRQADPNSSPLSTDNNPFASPPPR